MTESVPGHLITCRQHCPGVGMPWNQVAVEQPVRHTQIVQKIKFQWCKGSITVQAEKIKSIFFPTNLCFQLEMMSLPLFTQPPVLVQLHFLLLPPRSHVHRSSIKWSGCKIWESKELCSIRSCAINLTWGKQLSFHDYPTSYFIQNKVLLFPPFSSQTP